MFAGKVRAQCHKTVYTRNLRKFGRVFVSGKPFQLGRMFVGKFTQVGLGLTHKDQTRMKNLARDKHSNLLRTFVNFGRKSFMTLGPGAKPKGSTRLGSVLTQKHQTRSGLPGPIIMPAYLVHS